MPHVSNLTANLGSLTHHCLSFGYFSISKWNIAFGLIHDMEPTVLLYLP